MYKVVTSDLKSCFAYHSLFPKRFVIEYELNKWIYPHKGTHCWVFDSFNHAKNFFDNEYFHKNDYHIYFCDIGRIIKNGFCTSWLCIENELDKKLRKKKYECDFDFVALNTVFTNKVKLLQRVY